MSNCATSPKSLSISAIGREPAPGRRNVPDPDPRDERNGPLPAEADGGRDAVLACARRRILDA
jgi:hypothetical protein